MTQNTQNNSNSNKTGKAFNFVAWILGIFLLVKFFGNFEKNQINPNQNPDSVITNEAITLVLTANKSGHYVVNGYINNHPVTFLVDTGASYVSLSSNLAKKLNLQAEYPITLSTANGSKQGFVTKLNTVQIGEIKLNNVSAVFSENMSDEILLGMSVLKQLTMIHQDGKLLLKQVK